MESLTLSLNVVIPILLLILVGQAIRLKKLVSDSALTQMNQLVFRIFLPCTLFLNIYQTKLSTIDPGLIFFAVSCVLVSFGLALLIMPRFSRDRKKLSVMVMNTFRSSIALFGIPIAASIYKNADLGVTSMVVAVVVPMTNMLSVIVLEMYRGQGIQIKKILKGILTNPLIIGSFLGLVLMLANIKLPVFLSDTITNLSRVASPLALVVLGASFQPLALLHNLKELAVMVSARLVFVPLLFLSLAILIGYRDLSLVTLMVVFASPNAIASYSMAEAMGADGELASQGLLLSTVFCILTIFTWVFVFSFFGLI
ncbi:MAG: AEC family transporter [Erysipelotrichaceae bacterium]|jgi:predicted permease|nr:AEC family transporter [Erysipelotrichaceae bacterium]